MTSPADLEIGLRSDSEAGLGCVYSPGIALNILLAGTKSVIVLLSSLPTELPELLLVLGTT